MPEDKRRIGDNIIYNKYNGSPIEDAAIKLIKTLTNKLISCQFASMEATHGKNKTVRDNAAVRAEADISKLVDDLTPWFQIIRAKEIGADIHSYPYKSSKLDIVAGAETDFGQYIIDKEDEVINAN